MNRPIIQVRGLSKRYRIGAHRPRYNTLRESVVNAAKAPFRALRGRRSDEQSTIWALKDVSFDVQPGEVVGIIGRNGAGKSTLLKVLSRITEPTEGEVNLYGRVASLLEVGTGFHQELTGRENIYLNGAILGMRRAEIERKFDEIVAFADVEKFLDTPVKHYSSGMYVRLAFAVAAHMDPEILVIDEVLAVGDAQFQEKCLGKMDDVASQEGRTVLFVSHNMGTIMRLCGRSILLSAGAIEMEGGSPSVVNHYLSKPAEAYKGQASAVSDVYFKSIETRDSLGPQTSFAHSEPVMLRMVIGINRFAGQQNIGVALLTRLKNRVFTVNKPLCEVADGTTREVTVDLIIEGGLIAPNDYSFTAALNTPNGTVTYESHADVCPIRIYDSGTRLAFAEGFDYGSIILKDRWDVISRT